MISYDEIRETLENEFKANWDKTLISWNNAPIEITEDEYVRFFINWNGARNVTLGVNDTRKSGLIAIQIFLPRDSGTGVGVRYADEINAFMENKQFGKIFTYAGDLFDIGEGMRKVKDVEYGYFQFNLNIPFEAQ